MTTGRFRRHLVASVVALDLFVAAALGYAVKLNYATHVEEADLRVRNMAALLLQGLENDYERVDQTLALIAAEHARSNGDPDDRLFAWIGTVRALVPAVSLIRIADARGNVVYAPRAVNKAPVNLADRDYFKRLRDDRGAGLQISPPLHGRLTDVPLIALSRRLEDSTGRFNGIVIASIPLANLARRFEPLQLGPADAVGLRDGDLNWLARQPPLPEKATPGSTTMTTRFRQILASAPESGVFDTGNDTLDGIDRKYAYRRSKTYGFYVTAGVSRDAYIAEWRSETGIIVFMFGIFALLTGALAWQLQRTWARQSALTEALRRDEERIRDAERIGRFGHFRLDVAADRWVASDSFYDLTGIAREGPHTWAAARAVVHSDDQGGIRAVFAQALASRQERLDHEYRILRPDNGAVRWLAGAWRISYAADGGASEILGTLHDVTDRHVAENARRESDARFRHIFNNALIGIALSSTDRRILMANAFLCELLGYASDELCGMTWAEITHPDDVENNLDVFRRAMAGEIDGYRFEKRYLRKEGGIVHAEIATRVLRRDDGAIDYFITMVQDISTRKKNEAVLRQSEAIFRSVFENSMVGMATTSLEKGWIEINRTLCDILGYSSEELRQKTWAELTHPDDLAADVAQFNQVLAGEIDAYQMDKRFLRKDGTVIDAYIAARAVRRADGSLDHFVALVQDITPRKRAEARLRESEELLRNAFEQAAVGIAFVAADGRWLRVNERLCELLGYPGEEMIAQRFQDILDAGDRAANRIEATRLLAGEVSSYRLEVRLIRRDGRAVWVNLTASLAHHADGSPKHFIAVIEDIDARRAAERAERQSRDLLLRFLDHLPGVAYIKDPDLTVIHANRRFQDQLGMAPENIIGRTNVEIFPGDFGEKISADDRRILVSGRTEMIEEVLDDRIFETTKFIIPQDDGPPLLGGISLDITARYLLEMRTRALLEINELGGVLPEKEFLTHGLELAEQLTRSAIGFLHFVNEDQETIELVTWTAGALKGCTAAYDAHYPISQAGIWANCVHEKAPVVYNDYATASGKRGLPDGHAQLKRLVSVPVIEEGMIRMMIGVGNKTHDYDDFDITTVQLVGNDLWRIVRRARAEAALARRLAEVTELKEKLEQAHLQLLQSEKMSAIGQLAAGVAHELNNPIGFVTSNLGTLGDYINDLLAIDAALGRVESALAADAANGLLDEVRLLKARIDYDYLVADLPNLIRESKEGLERVRKIVLDLKDFSRVGEVDWQWADLHQCLDSTINIVWNELKYKAEVERAYGALPPVRCLPSQLNQVFMNLLVNAAQAIETRGRIAVRTGCSEHGSTVWIEIEDSGRGMTPEVQRRLFEPFFTTKPVGKGTGLGLSISFSIIEKHRGKIEVRSAVGRGSTFRITLPIDPEPTEEKNTSP